MYIALQTHKVIKMVEIKKGIPISRQIPELMKQAKLKVKLPFKATGFTSTKKPKGISNIDAENGEARVDVAEVVGESKPTEIIKVTPQLKYKEKLIKLKGIGEETAEEIIQLYPNWEDFVKKVTLESLEDVSGIGKSRAKQIMEQVK